MGSKNLKVLFIMIVLVAVILACGLPAANNTTQAPATEAAGSVTQDTAATPAPPPTEIAVGQHTSIPVNLPANRSSHAGDYDSSTTAANKAAAGGDRFTFGRFERPFNANTMDTYFPHLDIVDTFVYQDETWIYGMVVIKGASSSSSLADKYAMELDLDLDGKGDWLIVATNPASKDWSVDGVQVYQDANKDVGNKSAMFTDEKATGDGFEKLAFGQGTGDDPDTAWARISPDDANTVELAVKRSVLGNPEKYLINMWAGTSLLDPALFDINDHFTHEQAGAADPGLEIYYPIKAVFEIDNSCRMAVGFKPTGQEPGLCEVFVPKDNTAPTNPAPCVTSPLYVGCR
jgi:hypothetical protein